MSLSKYKWCFFMASRRIISSPCLYAKDLTFASDFLLGPSTLAASSADLNWNSIHLPLFLKSVIIMESPEGFSVTLYLLLCWGAILFCSDDAYMMIIELLLETEGGIKPAFYYFLSLWKSCYLLSQKGNSYCYAWHCRMQPFSCVTIEHRCYKIWEEYKSRCYLNPRIH